MGSGTVADLRKAYLKKLHRLAIHQVSKLAIDHVMTYKIHTTMHAQLCIYTLLIMSKPTATVHTYIVCLHSMQVSLNNTSPVNFLEHVNGWSYLAMDCDEIVSCAHTCII